MKKYQASKRRAASIWSNLYRQLSKTRFRAAASLLVLAAVAAAAASFVPTSSAQRTIAEQAGDQRSADTAARNVSPEAARQIQELRAEKLARTPAQKKMSSKLVYELKMRRGERITESLPELRRSVRVDSLERTVVNVSYRNRKAVLNALENLGDKYGEANKPIIISGRSNPLMLQVRVDQLEEIAAWDDVIAVRIPLPHRTSRAAEPVPASLGMFLPNLNFATAWMGETAGKTTAARTQASKQEVTEKITSYLSKSAKRSDDGRPAIVNTSEGDAVHGASGARGFYGTAGTGIKIGVISDGVDGLATAQGSGDLGPVTVLPGQAGSGAEGTAMLEIVRDIAPGAQLYFSTALPNEATFAQNILDLRAAGCDIIVDDIIYLAESPFQDGPVAQAVNTVTASGALYFSSAGNEGNKNDGTSGTWEGDFLASGSSIPALVGSGPLHNFGDGGNSIAVEFGNSNTPAILTWAEHYDLATGSASTDFDVYVMNGALTTIFDASADTQDGTGGDDFPIEFIGGGVFSGERIVIAKFADGATSSTPMMNLILFRGELAGAVTTSGTTRGHSSAAAAFSVAASPAGASFDGVSLDGPFPSAFTGLNTTESFSADGPRRVILSPTGAELTPGNRTVTGGVVRQKPDITAADGVAVSGAGGFPNPFYGTSAAAPHAAAIAALIKSASPGLTPAQIRTALISTAIDIEAPGVDRDTGAGIVMPAPALASVGAVPTAFLTGGAPVFTGGDNDGAAEPCETLNFVIPVSNNGGATATGVSATLTSTTPGVTIVQGTSTYPNIAAGGSANNNTAFGVSLQCGLACGTVVNMTLTITYASSTSPQVYNFSFGTGSAGAPMTFSYSGAAIAIPDGGDLSGTAPGVPALAPLVVAGVPGNIYDVNLRLDGTACSAAIGSTTVGIDHTFVNDLEIRLISPAAANILAIDNTDGSGNNFCQTLLDDESAGANIQSVISTQAPFNGSFKPNAPFAALKGQSANGTWNLSAQDFFQQDSGNIRAYSIVVTPAVCSVPQPPVFTPAAAVTRQQGTAPGAAVTIGTVSDPDTAVGTLTVTQVAGGTATGITITGITNVSGTISAIVSATCAATPGTVRFQVSDGTNTATGDLQVNVTPNTAPTLTYNTPAAFVFGQSGGINPTAAPTDNGSVTGTILQSPGTYTGGISVNNAGVVSITNAAPVGVHTITVRSTDNCGAVTDASFQLTVNKADTTTVLAAAPNPTTYGQNLTMTATVTTNAPGSGTPAGAVSFFDGGFPIPSCQNVAANGSGVATCTVDNLNAGVNKALSAVYSGNANFNGSTGAATQTINKAPLSVTADDKTKVYGSANPPLTHQIAGFVLGQTLATSGVTGVPNLTTTAAANSPVGAYPIDITNGSLQANNYLFNFTDGTLAVTPAELTVTADSFSRVYGQPNPSPLTYQFSGFVLGQVLANSGVTGTPAVSTTRVQFSPPGTYPVTIANGTLAAANYTFAFANGTAAVTQAATTTTITNAAALSATPTSVGQPYAVNFTVAPVAPGAGAPTGVVTVSDGTGATCTATLIAANNGVGSCSLTSTTPGGKTITASYPGDTNFTASASQNVPHQVVISVTGNVKQFIAFGTNTNLAGVTVTLTVDGTDVGTAMTDAAGNYAFGLLIAGGDVVVTPSGLGKTYEPTSRSYDNVVTNVAGADFVAYDANGPNANPRELKVVNTVGNAGQSVTVPVTMATAQGNETSVSFTLAFDPALLGVPTSATCGSGFVGCTVATFDVGTPGRVGVTVTRAAVLTAGVRQVALITFPTFANTAGSAQITFADAPTLRDTRDGGGNPLPTLYTGGFVSFTPDLEGDVVRGNGTAPGGDGVLANDVTVVRQMALGLIQPTAAQYRNADSAPKATLGDGCPINSTDVTQTARYNLGLDAPAGAGGPAAQNPGACAPPNTRDESSEIVRGDAGGFVLGQ